MKKTKIDFYYDRSPKSELFKTSDYEYLPSIPQQNDVIHIESDTHEEIPYYVSRINIIFLSSEIYQQRVEIYLTPFDNTYPFMDIVIQ
ncbi:hypothetical protein [Arcticibacter svalbardensis]|uniref:hypothetical protein n=1 Tax=Arcticibacter svalbardensis TaxID=1288027 RepID=UPI0005912FAF|nr:hypothetical protein [Arcticibacter svalbardensis]